MPLRGRRGRDDAKVDYDIEHIRSKLVEYFKAEECHLFGSFNNTAQVIRDGHIKKLVKLGLKEPDAIILHCKALNKVKRKFLTISSLVSAVEEGLHSGSYLSPQMLEAVKGYMKDTYPGSDKASGSEIDALVAESGSVEEFMRDLTVFKQIGRKIGSKNELVKALRDADESQGIHLSQDAQDTIIDKMFKPGGLIQNRAELENLERHKTMLNELVAAGSGEPSTIDQMEKFEYVHRKFQTVHELISAVRKHRENPNIPVVKDNVLKAIQTALFNNSSNLFASKIAFRLRKDMSADRWDDMMHNGRTEAAVVGAIRKFEKERIKFDSVDDLFRSIDDYSADFVEETAIARSRRSSTTAGRGGRRERKSDEDRLERERLEKEKELEAEFERKKQEMIDRLKKEEDERKRKLAKEEEDHRSKMSAKERELHDRLAAEEKKLREKLEREEEERLRELKRRERDHEDEQRRKEEEFERRKRIAEEEHERKRVRDAEDFERRKRRDEDEVERKKRDVERQLEDKERALRDREERARQRAEDDKRRREERDERDREKKRELEQREMEQRFLDKQSENGRGVDFKRSRRSSTVAPDCFVTVKKIEQLIMKSSLFDAYRDKHDGEYPEVTEAMADDLVIHGTGLRNRFSDKEGVTLVHVEELARVHRNFETWFELVTAVKEAVELKCHVSRRDLEVVLKALDKSEIFSQCKHNVQFHGRLMNDLMAACGSAEACQDDLESLDYVFRKFSTSTRLVKALKTMHAHVDSKSRNRHYLAISEQQSDKVLNFYKRSDLVLPLPMSDTFKIVEQDMVDLLHVGKGADSCVQLLTDLNKTKKRIDNMPALLDAMRAALSPKPKPKKKLKKREKDSSEVAPPTLEKKERKTRKKEGEEDPLRDKRETHQKGLEAHSTLSTHNHESLTDTPVEIEDEFLNKFRTIIQSSRCCRFDITHLPENVLEALAAAGGSIDKSVARVKQFDHVYREFANMHEFADALVDALERDCADVIDESNLQDKSSSHLNFELEEALLDKIVDMDLFHDKGKEVDVHLAGSDLDALIHEGCGEENLYTILNKHIRNATFPSFSRFLSKVEGEALKLQKGLRKRLKKEYLLESEFAGVKVSDEHLSQMLLCTNYHPDRLGEYLKKASKKIAHDVPGDKLVKAVDKVRIKSKLALSPFRPGEDLQELTRALSPGVMQHDLNASIEDEEEEAAATKEARQEVIREMPKNGVISMEFSCDKLPKMDTFGLSDPLFKVLAQRKRKEDCTPEVWNHVKNNLWEVVYTSDHIEKTLTPHWLPFILKTHLVCHDHVDWPIMIQVFDWNRDADDDYIGEFETTLEKIMERAMMPNPAPFVLLNKDEKEKIKKGKYSTAGRLYVHDAEVFSPMPNNLLKGVVNKIKRKLKAQKTPTPSAVVNGIGYGKAAATRGVLHFVLEAKDLPKMDTFGKADPFYQIFRMRLHQSKHGIKSDWVKVIQSPYELDTLTPRWKPMIIRLWDLCRGDIQTPLLIRVFDWDAHSAADLIGEFIITLDQLLEEKESKRALIRGRDDSITYGKVKIKTRMFLNHEVVEKCRSIKSEKKDKIAAAFAEIDASDTDASASSPSKKMLKKKKAVEKKEKKERKKQKKKNNDMYSDDDGLGALLHGQRY